MDGSRLSRYLDWVDKIHRCIDDSMPSYTTRAVREAVSGLTKELRARVAPDRELLIRTAALVAAGVASHYPSCEPEIVARKSVILARAIVAEVDAEQLEEEGR